MRGSTKIGTIAGIPIRVHWSFPIIIMFLLFDNWGATSVSWSNTWPILVFIVALFAFVTMHELAHCAVARRRGLTVRDIVLLPIGGVSEISSFQASPKTERDVALAGPLASFGIAIVLGVVAFLTGGLTWPPALFSGSMIADLAWLNLVLGAFNLLPALPMDGGRVLRAILAGRGNAFQATRIASGVAMALGLGMIVFGFRYDVWLVVIGAFVIVGANAERRSAAVQASFNGLRVGDVMVHDPTTVLAEVTAQQLLPWLQTYPGRAVPIVDGSHYLGIAGVEDLIVQPWASAGDACDRKAPVLDAAQPLYPGALEAFSFFPRNQLAVMSGGHVVGVLYRWTLAAVARRQSGSFAGAQPGGSGMA
jgi:Zn-dependent protease